MYCTNLHVFQYCRRGTGAFYCHVAVPIAEQLVIFSEGDWENKGVELEVILSYKDDEIVLGKITESNKYGSIIFFVRHWQQSYCHVYTLCLLHLPHNAENTCIFGNFN